MKSNAIRHAHGFCGNPVEILEIGDTNTGMTINNGKTCCSIVSQMACALSKSHRKEIMDFAASGKLALKSQSRPAMS